ncbi:MAG: hypothetical protein ABL931_18330 [Usitatibacteraceae bacterium]
MAIAQSPQPSAQSVAQPAAKSALIPIEDFVRHPEFESISLSPDGKSMAVVARHRDRANLGIIDLEARKMRWITALELYDVYDYDWISNDRITVRTVDTLDDATGNIYLRGSFAINTDGTGQRDIGGFDVLDESAEKPGSVIVLARGRTSQYPEVYRLDTRNGQRELLTFDNPGEVVNWVVDRKDEVRIAMAWNKNIVKIYYRENQKAPWAKIEEFDSRQYTIQPLAFDYDNRTLYVRSNKDRNKAALFRYDLEKKALGELIAENEAVDIGGLRFDEAKKKLVGIGAGTSGHGARNVSGIKWLDPDWERVQKLVDGALPDRVNRLSWGSKTPYRVLVSSWSDVHPGSFYLLDTRTNKMERLAESRSWIDSEKMSPVRRVQYNARDGLAIPALLTLPKSAGARRGYPRRAARTRPRLGL